MTSNPRPMVKQNAGIKREPGVCAPYTTVATRDAQLVVRDSFREIWKDDLAHIEEPKVRDVLAAQCLHGNTAFVLFDWKGLGQPSDFCMEQKKDQFDPHRSPLHEIAHLAGLFGHTMQQEYLRLPFEAGLRFGLQIRHWPSEMLQTFHDDVFWFNYQEEAPKIRKWQHFPVDHVSRRDEAVYFAAGLYLREKIDAYFVYGMQHKPYAQQLAFCSEYAEKDGRPLAVPGVSEEMILDAPASLIQLSDKEWKAITRVALNLTDPMQEKDAAKNPYPKRLSMVREVLEKTGIFHDMRPELARAQESHEANMRQYAAFAELTEKPYLNPTRPMAPEPFDFAKQEAARREKQQYRQDIERN